MKQNNNESNALLITLLFPFVGLIYSLANWRRSWAKNAFWLACIYTGAILIYCPEGTILGSGADSGRYVLELQGMHDNVNSFAEVAQNFYDGVTNDIFQPTLTFLVSRFTDNGHVLFFFLAIIYGFFYSRNMWYVLEKLPTRLPKGIWVLIAFLFLVCPIWEINGFRMWTALHIFVYGALPYIIDGKKRKLIWSALSLLVHHSFILPIAILGVYMLLSRSLKRGSLVMTIFFIIYLVSLMVKTLNISAISEVLTAYMPDYYDMRIEGYLDDEVFEKREQALQARSLYVVMLTNLKYWSVQVLVLISYISLLRNSTKDNKLIPLFSFSLLLYSFANIASLTPSGARYILIAQMFMVPLFILLFSTHTVDSMWRWLLSLSLVCIFVSLLFNLRQGLDYYGITLIFGNFITMFFIESNIPIINFIKQIV